MIKVKSGLQIDRIDQSCAVVLDTLGHISSLNLVGMTTNEIDLIIGNKIAEAGATSGKGYRGFPANSCISINDELVHGIPSDRVIEDGDLVSVDLFLSKNGWWGDSATTFLACDCYGRVGGQYVEVSDDVHLEQRNIVRAVEKAFRDAFALMQNGTRLQEIVNATEKSISKSGYFTNHKYTGHGIGKNLHEPPIIPCMNNAPENIKLVPGLVLAIEPLVQVGDSATFIDEDSWTVKNANGELCSHFERCVEITEDGPKILGGQGACYEFPYV